MKSILTKLFLIFVLMVMTFGTFNEYIYASSTVPESVTTTLSTFVYNDSSLLSDTLKKLDANVELKTDQDFEDKMFYRVSLVGIIEGKIDGDYGYVLIAHTIDSNTKSPERKLEANAKIKNDNSYLYTKNQSISEYTKTEIVLNKNTEVKVLDGYDKNKEFTFISYKQENGMIAYYYIETVNLSVSGVNYSLVVGIISMIAAVSIVLAILGVKGKKKKR